MPANPRSLALTDRFWSGVLAVRDRAAAAVTARLAAVDPTDIETSMTAFAADAARAVAGSRMAAGRLAGAYVSTTAVLELPQAIDIPPPDVQVDVDRLRSGLEATRAKMLAQLAAGRTVAEVFGFARFSAVRFAQTETLDGARDVVRAHAADVGEIRGWRWRSRGTCGACLALDNGQVRPGEQPMPAHPNCECVPEVVFDVRERVKPETGRERFLALARVAQDAILGPEKAELVRSGAVAWSDLVQIQRHEDWRPNVMERPLEDLQR